MSQVGHNSVEMAMEWLFSHPEDPSAPAAPAAPSAEQVTGVAQQLKLTPSQVSHSSVLQQPYQQHCQDRWCHESFNARAANLEMQVAPSNAPFWQWVTSTGIEQAAMTRP